MNSRINYRDHFASLIIVCVLICCASGCSSLGLSVWPASFPLLKKTKELAAAAPIPSSMPNELSKLELSNYFVEPGDRVLIEPVNLESEISSLGDQKVQIDGSIDLGKVGRLRVAGMTVEEIERAVEDQIALSGEREPINVRLVETNAAEVYVLGEVGSPAAYPLNGHEHVLDAILQAGGLTSKASPCDIILVRPTDPGSCRVVLPVCYRQITQMGDVTTNYQLQPGDRIVVGARSFMEELSLRKQRKSCDRCCQSSGVECQPTKVQYRNRFAFLLQPFSSPEHPSLDNVPATNGPTPKGSPTSEEQSTQDADTAQKQETSPYYIPDVTETDASRDEDFFLPSRNADGDQKPMKDDGNRPTSPK